MLFKTPFTGKLLFVIIKKIILNFSAVAEKHQGRIYVPESIYNLMQLLYCTQFKSLLKLQFSNPQRNCRSGTIKKNVVQKSCNKETSLTESSSDVTE